MQMMLGLSKDRWALYDEDKMMHLQEHDIIKLKSFEHETSLFTAVNEWLLELYIETPEINQVMLQD